MFCEFASYFVHHPNYTTRVARLDCTTNVKNDVYVFLFQTLFHFLFVFVLCLYIDFLLSKVGAGFCFFY
jgi:hypothetical protein